MELSTNLFFPHASHACRLATLAATAIGLCAPAVAQFPAVPGWTLVWNDEFEGSTLDSAKWQPETTNNPANNERQAYRPAQVTVSGGNMVITSENIPTGGKQYVSGRVHSVYAQRHGRWEVRAKLPTSRGMWPAIWLLPNTSQYNWPSQGEIDIMENRGTQPYLTSSAYYFGTNPPYFHDYRYSEQTTARFGQPVDYHADFHTYAVEWNASMLRFFVDDVHHWTLYNSDTNGYLGNQTAPMRTMLNTAVGGDFLGSLQPNESTVWPQQFLIDYVRIYEANDDVRLFRNGAFEANEGSLAHWSRFGNRVNRNNVSVHNEAAVEDASLKLFGQGLPSTNYSGVAQGITVAAGDEVRAFAESFIRSQDSIAGTSNSVVMKIEFYSEFGGRHGSSAFLNEVTSTIATASSEHNQWQPHALSATAPAGAVEARLAFVFVQQNNGGGAGHVDNVSFINSRLSPPGDANGDGSVDADDLSLWQRHLGSEILLGADANRDGRVDGADYLIWQQNLSSSATSAAALPEPAGLAVAMLALAPAVPLVRGRRAAQPL
ncbi:MAG TPA: family 16 glycosylhydrolase [Lacipirellulaceae bacterium]|nr:family 16 glycosylhydrolase [Lacipirellulaceae bacterium]